MTRFGRIIIVAVGILLIPFIAMQYTTEVNWSFMDFFIFGIMLFSVGLGIDFAILKVKNGERRAIIIITIIVVFLLIWAELAVGLFETSFAGS